jgi:hypothetical protein
MVMNMPIINLVVFPINLYHICRSSQTACCHKIIIFVANQHMTKATLYPFPSFL